LTGSMLGFSFTDDFERFKEKIENFKKEIF
jgi:hypothetical protein